VSTKVPARKRFHENLFVAGEKKALSSRFFAHKPPDAHDFVVLERRQQSPPRQQRRLRERKSARAWRAKTESAFISNKALSP